MSYSVSIIPPECNELILVTPSGKRSHAFNAERDDPQSPHYLGERYVWLQMLKFELSQKSLDRYAKMKAERLCRARRTEELSADYARAGHRWLLRKTVYL